MPLNVGILDPSLVTQGVRESKIDLATPVNIYTSMRADRRAQKLSELTLDKEERERKRAVDLQSIIQSNLTQDGHIDTERIIPELNKRGFVDEAASIQDRYLKAAQAREKAKQEAMSAAGQGALSVVDAKDKTSAFLQFQKYARENNLPISEDVKNYSLSDEEGHTGQLHPKIMSYLNYLGDMSLTPEQKLARQKAAGEGAAKAEEYFEPKYAKQNGKDVLVYPSKSGKLVVPELPEGLTLAPGIQVMDLDDKKVILGKDGKPIAEFKAGIDPGKRQDLAIKGQELGLKKEEAERKAVEFEAKKLDLAKKARAYDAEAKGAISSLQTFLDKANSVKNSPYLSSISGTGRYNPKTGSKVPFIETPGKDLQADVDFLVSSGVIETMMDLKSKSPTGATGFGALSEKEMKVLKDAFSILGNEEISANKRKEELNRVIGIMDKRMMEHRALLRESDGALGPEKSEEEQFNEELKSDW